MKKSILLGILILSGMDLVGCNKLMTPSTPTLKSASVPPTVQTSVPQFASSWSNAGSTDLVNPKGIAVDANGDLYVTDLSLDQVFKFDPNGGLLAQWGRSGVSLDQPTGIVVSGNNVFVADSANARVVEYDLNGNQLAVLSPTDSNNNLLFLYPTGVSIDNQGNLYVSDNSDQVFQFNKALQLTATWGASGATNGAFDYPVDSTEDNSGNIYVVNNNSDSIAQFSTLGGNVSTWGAYGQNVGQFDGPSDVKLDRNGNVYVVDTGNDRVEIFTSNGTYVSQFGANSDPAKSLYGPESLTIDGYGNVYVVDNGNTRIVKFASN